MGWAIATPGHVPSPPRCAARYPPDVVAVFHARVAETAARTRWTAPPVRSS